MHVLLIRASNYIWNGDIVSNTDVKPLCGYCRQIECNTQEEKNFMRKTAKMFHTKKREDLHNIQYEGKTGLQQRKLTLNSE